MEGVGESKRGAAQSELSRIYGCLTDVSHWDHKAVKKKSEMAKHFFFFVQTYKTLINLEQIFLSVARQSDIVSKK